MRRTYKTILATGLSFFLAGSLSNCLLISDVLGVDPVGGVPVESVIKGAASSAAQGWYHGCGEALKTENEKYNASGFTENCSGETLAVTGGEIFALYGTAARNAANNMIAIAKANRHAYYNASGLEDCRSGAFTSAFLMTKIYLESTIDAPSADIIDQPELAQSTLFGVIGTGEACFENLTGTGRLLSVGELNL